MDLHLPELSSIKPIVTCTVEGIVDEDDLRILTSGVGFAEASPEEAQKEALAEAEDPADLKRVREKHHTVARLIAKGMQQSLVATISGYDQAYLSVLLNNPAMQELIEMYRMQAGAVHEVVGEKLRTVGLKALEKLDEQIEANKLSNNDLIQAAKLGFDRAGHGPTSTQRTVSETHILDHAELQKLQKNALAGSKEYIVPVEEVRQALLPAPETEADDADD